MPGPAPRKLAAVLLQTAGDQLSNATYSHFPSTGRNLLSAVTPDTEFRAQARAQLRGCQGQRQHGQQPGPWLSWADSQG